MHFSQISAKNQPRNLKFVHYYFLAMRNNISIGGFRAPGTPSRYALARSRDSEVIFSAVASSCHLLLPL